MDYLELNKRAWDNRTKVHIGSKFYDVEGFKRGTSSLKSIELDILPNLSSKEVLHLQCHFGLDTLSLAQLGASATGFDLSPVAISKAKELSDSLNIPATFICTDVYTAPDVIHNNFDIVYTSYGAIEWLPDLSRWAKVISDFLTPGGEFIIVEFHPFFYAHLGESYFNASFQGVQSTTYTDGGEELNEVISVWRHPISKVISSLIEHGLEITAFIEYPYSPFNCFEGLIENEPGKYFSNGGDIPIVYAIKARKKDITL